MIGAAGDTLRGQTMQLVRVAAKTPRVPVVTSPIQEIQECPQWSRSEIDASV